MAKRKQVKKTPRLVLTPEEQVKRRAARDADDVLGVNIGITRRHRMSKERANAVSQAILDMETEGTKKPSLSRIVSSKSGTVEGITDYMRRKRSGQTKTQQLASEKKRPRKFRSKAVKDPKLTKAAAARALLKRKKR